MLYGVCCICFFFGGGVEIFNGIPPDGEEGGFAMRACNSSYVYDDDVDDE